MADKQTAALTAAAAMDGTELVHVVQGGNSRKVASADLIPEASNADIWAGSNAAKRVSPRRLFTASEPVALASGATVTPDFGAGINFSLTLAENATLANPTNAKVGQSGFIEITQDGTGSRTLAYGANWKFPGGAPALSTAAGAIDLISYVVTASGRIIATLAKAFSS